MKRHLSPCIGWIGLLLMSACGDAVSDSVADSEVYTAALIHVDSALPLDNPILVHPNLLLSGPDPELVSPLDRTDRYEAHPTDAVRRGVAQVPRFTICQVGGDGFCVHEPEQQIIVFSRIDWSVPDIPRLHLTVVELFPRWYSARQFEVRLMQRSGRWTVRNFDFLLVEN